MKNQGTAKGVDRWLRSRRFDLATEGAQFWLVADSFGGEDRIAVWPAELGKLGEEWGADVITAARDDASGRGQNTSFRLLFVAPTPEGDPQVLGTYRIRQRPEGGEDDSPAMTGDLAGVVAMLLEERKHMIREQHAITRTLVQNTQQVLGHYSSLASTMLERATMLEAERGKVLEREREMMELEIAAGANLEEKAAETARKERLWGKGERFLDWMMAEQAKKAQQQAPGGGATLPKPKANGKRPHPPKNPPPRPPAAKEG